MSYKALKDFLYNQELDIFIHPEKVLTNYRDGSEDYVLSVLKDAEDTRAYSTGLSKYIKDWPSRYHFSIKRINLMESIKELLNKSSKVLEIGCGTGPVTRWLGEQFTEVDAIEGEQVRALATRHRTGDMENVSVFCGDVLKTSFEADQYGLITIIGVLEYIPFHETGGNTPDSSCMEFLKRMSSSLQDDGMLLLAIENKFGAKYFSGCKEDHTGREFDGLIDYPNKSPVTFSRNELQEILISSGFENIQFYHLFPDYKLPETVIKEDDEVLALSPYNWIRTPFEDYSGQRLHVFPELLFLKSITKAKILWDFSNSFLVLASKSKNINLVTEWLIKKFYTHEWFKPVFSHVITLNKKDNKGYVVRREPVYLGERGEVLKDIEYGLKRESNFVYGDSLSVEINRIILSHDYKEKLADIIKEINNSLIEEFWQGEVDDEGYPLLSGEAIDCTFFNLIKTADGAYVQIDRKWELGEKIPVDMILFRNLYNLYLHFRSDIPEKNLLSFILSFVKIIYHNYNHERMMKGVSFEEHFQTAVSGRDVTLDLNPSPVYSITRLVETGGKEISQYNMDSIKAALDKRDDYIFSLEKRMEEKDIYISSLNNYAYQAWINKNEPNYRELSAQRKNRFKYEPKISILTSAFNANEQFLKDLLESVLNQTYTNWELCIASGRSEDKSIHRILREYKEKYKRIIVKFLDDDKGIAGNSNEALSMSTGDFITFLAQGDILPLFTLYEVVKCINASTDADFIYSDEDRITENGKMRWMPHFKPDWSPDLLRSYNYIAHLTVLRKRLIGKIGSFREGFEDSEDYDFMLRATEQAGRIVHIPKVLYHQRISSSSEADTVTSKPYAFESAKKALREHLLRIKLNGKIEPGRFWGSHNIKYQLDSKPKVSIIIPSKDNVEDLRKCLESVMEKTAYGNYELIIMENNSVEEKTFHYYDEITKSSNVRIIKWERPFNFAAINNYAVKYADGEVLLFLNNDTVVINTDWIERLLEHAQRKEVGGVGAKLYYPDGLIQHAGVILGVGRVAGHSHKHMPWNSSGYFFRASVVQNLSAVTGACMMIRKDVFDEVEGFDERYSHNFNDIDLCMKIREKGYLIVFTPFAELYHHECNTRGYEDKTKMQARYWEEVKLFEEKWMHILDKGDPYYNPNLTLEKEDFSIRV